ncbi:hypothetical protein JCM8097_005453 [Rhodosporidiobolus ruineniae]
MSRDLFGRIESCKQCQLFGRQVFRTKLCPITVLRPMQLLAMDYLSLPARSGYGSVLVIMDYFSRYIWAFKYKGKGDGKKTVAALERVFETFGFPEAILSNNGSHFTAELVREYLKEKGVDQRVTPTYSPNVNGLVERGNGLLTEALEKACIDPEDKSGKVPNWPEKMDSIVARLNDRVVSSTGYRPSSLIFGFERVNPRSPAPVDEVLQEAFEAMLDRRLEATIAQAEAEGRAEDALAKLLKNQGVMKEKVDAKHQQQLKGTPPVVREELHRGDLVWVHLSQQNMSLNHKMKQEWDGPFRVVARGSDVAPDLSVDDPHASSVTFWLDDPRTGAAKGGRIHANRLKRYIRSADENVERVPLPSIADYLALQGAKRPETVLAVVVLRRTERFEHHHQPTHLKDG